MNNKLRQKRVYLKVGEWVSQTVNDLGRLILSRFHILFFPFSLLPANCMKRWKVALLAVGTLLLGMLLAAAGFVFYLRRMNKDNSALVTQDHLQSSFNADNTAKAI